MKYHSTHSIYHLTAHVRCRAKHFGEYNDHCTACIAILDLEKHDNLANFMKVFCILYKRSDLAGTHPALPARSTPRAVPI